MSFSILAKRHEREVHRVEHQLDAHEHHEDVAADEQARPPPIVKIIAATTR